MKNLFLTLFRGAAVLAAAAGAFAQAPPAAPPAVPATADRPAPVYILAPGDTIAIRAINAEELSKEPFRVDLQGYLNLPLVGRLKAAGLTVEQFEAILTDSLKVLIRNPQVSVSVLERVRVADTGTSVSLVGHFKAPGLLPVLGGERLMDVLVRSGGLDATASRRIRLVRRIEQGKIPLANSVADSAGNTTSAEIALTPNMNLVNPNDNIPIKAQDVITAERLEAVYATGELGKTGAFSIEDRDVLTMTQLISLAGGFTPAADPRNARVLRPVLDTRRRAEIPIDLESVLAGRVSDFTLLPNDLLVVPRKKSSRAAWLGKAAAVAIPAAVTSVIYILIRNH